MCSTNVQGGIETERLILRPQRGTTSEGRSAGFERALAVEHRLYGPIGVCRFTRPAGGLYLELGCWIDRRHWGQGFATEAAAAALGWARDVWGKRAVAAGHNADDRAAGRVLVKCGFLYTGDVVQRPCAARQEPVPTRMMIWLA